MTNRDFIRNLSNKEMAEYFCYYFLPGFRFMPKEFRDKMTDNIRQWLMEEHKENIRRT